MIILLLFIIFFLILLIKRKNSYDDTVEYYYNGSYYKIRPSSQQVIKQKLELLDNYKKKLNILVNYCKDNNYPNKEDSYRLYKRFQTIQINETSSTDNSAAYVVNKNEELRICLSNNDINDGMFVLIHELAHIMSLNYGHGDEFKNNMYLLLKLAVKLNLYKPVDYTKYPINYCGVNIYTTPCKNNNCK